jgi:pimeloyl-ACP methyl ester carboxylesterase
MFHLLTYLLVILFIILVIGSVTVISRYTAEIKSARERVDSLGSQVIETTCGPIEYARIGDGYPILVVHGALGGFDQGLWLAKGFIPTKYQVISISRFGYLRSPIPENANLDLQADAFACLLDALEIGKAALFAVSAGSTSAIRFAARHPERISALILSSPDAPGKVQMAMPPRFVFDTLLRSDFLYWAMVTFFRRQVQTAAGLVPKGYKLTPENANLVMKVQLGNLPVSRRMDGMVFESYNLDAEYKASVSESSPYPLSKVETPVLAIHAMDDPIVNFENVRSLVDQIPKSRLFVVPVGGHFFFGHTEEVKAEITRFLSSDEAELHTDHVLKISK